VREAVGKFDGSGFETNVSIVTDPSNNAGLVIIDLPPGVERALAVRQILKAPCLPPMAFCQTILPLLALRAKISGP